MFRRQTVQIAEIIIKIRDVRHCLQCTLHILDRITVIILAHYLILDTGTRIAGIIHREYGDVAFDGSYEFYHFCPQHSPVHLVESRIQFLDSFFVFSPGYRLTIIIQ